MYIQNNAYLVDLLYFLTGDRPSNVDVPVTPCLNDKLDNIHHMPSKHMYLLFILIAPLCQVAAELFKCRIVRRRRRRQLYGGERILF